MKRIYEFARKPALRNYTIADLQALKVTGAKLTMANPLTADEIRACKEAGIDLFVCGMDQIDDVRAIAPNHFCRVGSKWAQFDSNEELIVDAFGNVGRLHKQIHEERVAALGEFHNEVVARNFPYKKNNITMHDGEKDKFLETLDKWSPVHK